MVVPSIITDEKELRAIGQCSEVSAAEIGGLRAQLLYELEESGRRGCPGIGLAAPQIGIPKRMAIVKVTDDLEVTLVNCKIGAAFDLFIFDSEGCLSFPERYERTKRYREIYVIDNAVAPYNFIATDLFAVAVAHELDHLNGRLLPDLVVTKKSEKKKRRR